MTIFDDINIMQDSLDYHVQRQGVLVTNVAHADTPGFQAKDLSFQEVFDNLPMAGDHQHHIKTPQGDSSIQFDLVHLDQVHRPDGNGVELEKAMAQATANRLRIETALTLAKSRMAQLRYAASDGASS